MSKPLAFTVTSPGPVPTSTAPALASTNSLLDSLKKMQSSQPAPTVAGEEEEGQQSRTLAEQGRCSGCSALPLRDAGSKTPCSDALLAVELAGRSLRGEFGDTEACRELQ